MKLQESAVIETSSHRLVEMTFADQPDLAQATEFLTFRIAVEREGYPQLPAAKLEALQRVRDTIAHEIQRIEQIRGQVHPSEDWRK